jgi:hypothetical protein
VQHAGRPGPQIPPIGVQPVAPPVPLSATVCGVPAALSVTESVPVRLPVVIGVKVTSIVQLAPGVRLSPQLLLSAKSPLAAMAEIFSVAVP